MADKDILEFVQNSKNAAFVLTSSERHEKFASMEGVDGASSWWIAAACCFINMMMYGMTRLSGVLFVASVPRYGVGREEASFPYTFANFVRNTAGPLVGYLGHRLGVRPVTTFGCFLAAFGIGTCFFAEHIGTITVLWGTLFGLGFGLGNILLPVKINQYFDKYRATASGISFSGACLGSFILPPIVEILMDLYGLSGTFLVLAGLVLNCVPAALLLRKPDFILLSSKRPKEESVAERQSITSGKKFKLYTEEDATSAAMKAKKAEVQGSNIVTTLTNEESMKRLSTQTLVSNYSIRMSNPDPLNFEEIFQNSKGRLKIDQETIDCEVSSVASNNTDRDSVFAKDYVTATGDKVIKEVYSVSIPRRLSDGSSLQLPQVNLGYQYSKSFSDLYVDNIYQGNMNKDYMRKGSCHTSLSCAPSADKESAFDSFSVVSDPIFVLIAITNALYNFTFVCMVTVIVDFARDIDVGILNEKYILMSLSVGDLIGRLGLGWVTDKGYMTRSNFAALCFLCQGITTAAIAWSSEFLMLVSLAALYGLSEAGLILIFPLIVAEFIEEEKQTVAIPCTHFLAGPLCLTVAPLIDFGKRNMPGKRARRHFSQLSEFERGLIIGMKTAGWSTRRVTGQVDCLECAVRNCWQQWTREGTHERKTGSGATRKREDRRIVRQALVDPTVTRSTIRADVGVAMVLQTISRHLAVADLESKRPFRALPLTLEHRQLRLQWCQTKSMWNVTNWQKVVFSDESRFVLGTDDNRVRVWRCPGERYNSPHTVLRHTARTAGIMVWGP
ncbi:MFS domain-containing protein [Trichonephila clavipes]|nr:MFS domain-containing protein [Trichonephila clavipes]